MFSFARSLLIFISLCFSSTPSPAYQARALTPVQATGSGDAIVVSVRPLPEWKVHAPIVSIITPAANRTKTPTISINGSNALPITKNGGQSLAVGDIAANAHIILANIGASMEMLNAGSFPIASQFGADAGAHNNPVTADFHASEATQQTGVANVLDYRDKIVDGDWSVAIDDALSKAQKVIIPNMGFTYTLKNWIGKSLKNKSIPSNREIICVGRPTLKPIITGRVLRGVNVSNITIRGCDFDGNYGNVVSDGFFAFWSNVVGLTFEDNKITNGAGSSTITGTSQFNSFRIQHLHQ